MDYKAVKVVKNERLSDQEGRLWIESETLANTAKPGQFAMLSNKLTRDPFLPRAISINRIEGNKVAFAYQEVGIGTKALGQLLEGDNLFCLAPLGNHFDLSPENKRLMLIGGGIGRAPIEFLTTYLACKNNQLTVILGARTASGLCGLLDFKTYPNVDLKLVTDDGSIGKKGLVTDVMTNLYDYDQVYACGPTPMMIAVKNTTQKYKLPLQLSLEGKMACGVGVCLGCTCNSPKEGMIYPKVCKDGPVFWGEEVNLSW